MSLRLGVTDKPVVSQFELFLQRFALFGFGVCPHVACVGFEMVEGTSVGLKGRFRLKRGLPGSLELGNQG
jgi:hypothetical protein